MKFLHYIRYFFYIAWEWNVRIAWHIIRNEIRGEKQYGIRTTGADALQHLEKKGIDIDHATIYMPVSYDVLEDVFAHIPISDCRHFLDIGSGKGRALCMAAHYGVPKVTGIDFSARLCAAARANLQSLQQRKPGFIFNIINNDAFYYEIPLDVDCIFLFNPFDTAIMHGVVENILQSLALNPRKIILIYVNPQHKHLFTEVGFTKTYYTKKMNYLEALVMRNEE
jgi:SAM-dependent methyltransferase